MRRFSLFTAFLSALLPIASVTAAAQTNFGSVEGGSSVTSLVTLTISSAGTPESIAVVTQGATGVDYTDAGTGTCAVGTAYKIGSTCTVGVTFRPLAAGPRYGAAMLKDGSGNVLATTFLNGIGLVPLVTYGPGTSTDVIDPNLLSFGLNSPSGAVVDTTGNLYIADTGNSRVVEVAAFGGALSVINPTVFGHTLMSPNGVTIDGAGNLFISDGLENNFADVAEIPAGGGAPIGIAPTVDGIAMNVPAGMAVDGAGNLFIADYGNNRVVEVPAGGGAPTAIQPTVNGVTITCPFGLAIDGSGNLFIGDNCNNRVVEVPAGGGAATAIVPTVNGTLLNSPHGVAVDAAGDLFIADFDNSRVVELPAGGGAAIAIDSGANLPIDVALDTAGDQFIVQFGHNRVVEFPISHPPNPLSFANSAVGATSVDSPKQVVIRNIGNQTLTFSSLSYPPDFPEEADGPDPCTSSTSLSAGGACNLNIDFTPLGTGSWNELLLFNSNAFNTIDFQLGFAMIGTGTSPGATQSLSVNSLSFGSQEIGTASPSQQVTLTNTGSVAIDISSIALTGANPDSFSFGYTCGGKLAVGASCIMHGHMQPQAAGSLSAAITINDSASGSPLSVALTGTGIAPPTVALSITGLVFGPQEVGTTSASQQVTLTNTGSFTLHIMSLAVAGTNASSFGFANTCGSSVAPGGVCTIHGHFTPVTGGNLTAYISIIDDAGNSPQSILLMGTGETRPTVSLSANSLAFGSQELNFQTSQQTVTVTNVGALPLNIAGLTLAGPQETSFLYTSNCGRGMISGASCTIQVRFDPQALGAASGVLTINDNASDSPQSISLTGTGSNSPSTTVSLSATSLAFGSAPLNFPTPAQTVTLTNTGSGLLTISGFRITGPQSTSFIDSTSCGLNLASAASCSIRVRFSPVALGAASASLTITDNASGSPQSVSLTGTGTSSPATTVSLSTTNLAFGTQELNLASDAQIVTLTNTGTQSLSIASVRLTGAQYQSYLYSTTCGLNLAPGASCSSRVRFDPVATGLATAALTITDNAAGSPHSVSLSGTGTSTPPATTVSLSSTSIAFGSVAIGLVSPSQTVILTNTGSAALTIGGIQVIGPGASAFGFANECVSPLAAGASCTIHGHFAPTATGARTATLTIVDNATGSPQAISLIGTGITPSATTVSFSPAIVAYGNEPVGWVTEGLGVLLTNTGSGSLTIGRFQVTGPDVSSFGLDFGDCLTVLSPGASCEFGGHFQPKALGPLTATITIFDNAVGSPQSVTLTGTGITPPTVSLSTTSLTFGNQNVGTSSLSQDVTLTNTGAATLHILSFGVTGAGASSFFFGNGCGATVAAGASCIIHGHFAPTVVGALTAVISITDDTASSPQTIALSGTGQ